MGTLNRILGSWQPAFTDNFCSDLRPSEIFIDKEGHACLYKLPFTIYSEIKSSDIYPEYTGMLLTIHYLARVYF